MAWNALTGKLYKEITEADDFIRLWWAIYQGKQKWLEYSYIGLDSRKHKRTRKTMNAAKLVSAEIANLVWSEEPEINAGTKIEEWLKDNHFFDFMSVFTEYGAALGGFAIKPYSKDGQTLNIDYVSAENFIPISWDSSGITEADFVSRLVQDGKSYVKIEKHRKQESGYKIDYDLYEEIGSTLKKVPASTLDLVSTALIIDRPPFVYIKTPEANNIAISSPLGISCYANAVDTLEALDIAFDALQHEIVIGKRRIIVPTSAVRVVIDQSTQKPVQYFDPADETFVAFNDQERESMKITDNTVELRIDDITKAIQTLLNILAVQVGFSAGAFSFDGVSVKTATEIISENSKTFRTKKSYENNIGAGIVSFLEIVKAIGADYNLGGDASPVTIEWNDSIIEDRKSKADYWNARFLAGTVNLETVLQELDGLTEAEAAAMAEKIRSENSTVNVDAFFDQE
jgi:A118 family predicted phage portal protein